MTDPRAAVLELLERERPRRDAALAAAPLVRASDPEVAAVVDALASPGAAASLADDPYWPKWDSPWWQLLTLLELGLVDQAPAAALDALAGAVREKYLAFFPFTEDQVPPGTDPYRDVLCHCALGCLSRLLHAGERDPGEAVPWSRGWFLRYQLPDGGLNCDEAAYLRPTPRSSVVSTVPALEALLDQPERAAGEDAFLARGVHYLLQRRLGCLSLSKGGPIDASWLDPVFPRFYLYDVLRGLTLVTRWARAADEALPAEALVEALEALAARVAPDGTLAATRDDHALARTVRREGDGWGKGPSSTFALLERVRRGPSRPLTRAWYDALDDLAALAAEGRLA
ncbi:MAG: hypothetical protein KF878_07045 [Planctomycetes bacterium]|nr:hypothetical protein [Planctomycetota bacterium]